LAAIGLHQEASLIAANGRSYRKNLHNPKTGLMLWELTGAPEERPRWVSMGLKCARL